MLAYRDLLSRDIMLVSLSSSRDILSRDLLSRDLISKRWIFVPFIRIMEERERERERVGIIVYYFQDAVKVRIMCKSGSLKSGPSLNLRSLKSGSS